MPEVVLNNIFYPIEGIQAIINYDIDEEGNAIPEGDPISNNANENNPEDVNYISDDE